jgi:AraC-like DNA-binding protein
VERFGPGDLVLTGPNLPHVWRSDERYFGRHSDAATRGIVVYFREAILGSRLLDTQEGLRLKRLLERSERGLAFHGRTGRDVRAALTALLEADGFAAIIGLLQILHTLSLSAEYRILSTSSLTRPLRPEDQARMQQVCSYVMERFTAPIRLADVASVASMAPTAFCRYFRERTNKSLGRFVAELRIGYARKLLVEQDLAVARVAQDCGYATLSNFNRQFKSISGLTPSAYRRAYAGALGGEGAAGQSHHDSPSTR